MNGRISMKIVLTVFGRFGVCNVNNSKSRFFSGVMISATLEGHCCFSNTVKVSGIPL